MYLNEWDAFPAEWLRNQYPEAWVDETSIQEVIGDGLTDELECHLFAGIGGWPAAIRLAGWPADQPVWTGSCPCQPFSVAGKGKGEADERNLWPDFYRIICRQRPATIFGEQVDGAAGIEWLDRVSRDLEAADYFVWSAVAPAAGLGAPILRHRIFWGAGRRDCYGTDGYDRKRAQPVGLSESIGDRYRLAKNGTAEAGSRSRPFASGELSLRPQGFGSAGDQQLPRTQCSGCPGWSRPGDERPDHGPQTGGASRQLVRTGDARPQGHAGHESDGDESRQLDALATRPVTAPSVFNPPPSTLNPWSDFEIIHFTDGKTRRIEPGLVPVAHGLPAGHRLLVARLGELGIPASVARRMVADFRRNRVGRLKGYGNAIVPQLAAAFVRTWMDEFGI